MTIKFTVYNVLLPTLSTQQYVWVCILLTCGIYFHDLVISLITHW